MKALLLDVLVQNWLASLLLLVVVASSIQLAFTTHQARSLTARLQKLVQLQADEQILWESYRLERTSLREPDRISKLAKKQLGMVEVGSKNEKVIAL